MDVELTECIEDRQLPISEEGCLENYYARRRCDAVATVETEPRPPRRRMCNLIGKLAMRQRRRRSIAIRLALG